jgi:hypothetical protein
MKSKLALVIGAISATLVAAAFGAGVTQTFTTQGAWRSTWSAGCSIPTPPGSNQQVCFSHTAVLVMPVLGPVSVSFLVTQNYYQPCSHLAVSGGVLTTRDRGSLRFTGTKPDCAGSTNDTFLKGRVPLTITDGDGDLAGASGQGTLTLGGYLAVTGSSGRGTGDLSLAVSAPNGRFDITPPTLSGAIPKTVKANKGARRVRVTYRVTAQDAVDGPIPVVCTPRSGSFFRVGRTMVTCSSKDKSGNMATAHFTITVTRVKG